MTTSCLPPTSPASLCSSSRDSSKCSNNQQPEEQDEKIRETKNHIDTSNSKDNQTKTDQLKANSNITNNSRTISNKIELNPDLLFCKICNKLFDNLHRLQRHMMSHDMSPELRKFKCDYCNKAFKFKHHLKVSVNFFFFFFSTWALLRQNTLILSNKITLFFEKKNRFGRKIQSNSVNTEKKCIFSFTFLLFSNRHHLL